MAVRLHRRAAFAVGLRMGLDRTLGVRPDVAGLHALPDGGKVVAFNHLSPLDPFVLAWVLADAGHDDPVVLLRDDAPSSPLVAALTAAGSLTVEPDDSSDRDTFTRALDQLSQGRTVLMAPERATSPSLELMPLRSGPARLATTAGVPLVATGMFGTHRLFDANGQVRLRRNVPIHIAFGHPVMPAATVHGVTKMLRLDLEALYEQVLDDYPDREVGADTEADWWPARRGGGAPSFATVIDAGGIDAWTDAWDPDPADVDVWADDTDPGAPTHPVGLTDDEQDEADRYPIHGLTADEIAQLYPRSFHRNQAQQGGYLRDLKAVLAFDRPGQPTETHGMVHLDHHADGKLTVHTPGGRVVVNAAELSVSPVRVLVYGRLLEPHLVDGTVAPSGTVMTVLGVPQHEETPEAITDWQAVDSILHRA